MTQPWLHDSLIILGALCLLASAGYGLISLLAVLIWHRMRPAAADTRQATPAVTIMKPLCGAESGLADNLRSFFQQDYPHYQLVFGVRDESDPAVGVVRALVQEFPQVPTTLIVSAHQHGSNRKVSNLINMLPAAAHDILTIVDSDVRVNSDYLHAIVRQLAAPGVGLVSCAYRSTPDQGLWSRLGALYINDWYIPSVLLAHLFGHRSFASGQTLCLTRRTLEDIGGLTGICNHLADDYEMGERVRRLGLKTVLSHYVTRTQHSEPSFKDLVGHEIRWMRTIRALQPQAFRFLFISFNGPLAALGLALMLCQAPWLAWPGYVFGGVVVLRGLLHLVVHHDRQRLIANLWLVPLRDLLMLWVWWKALRTSRVSWRGHHFWIDSQGIMRALQ